MNIIKIGRLSIFCVLLIIVFTIVVFSSHKVKAEPVEDTTTLTTTVLEYISFSLTSGDTVSFGDLTPGESIKAPATSTIASVTTNAANGYTIGLSDGVASTNSSMLHTVDETTYIPDYAGTIGTPTAWTGTGVGITLWDADSNYDAKWCADACTSYDDTDNKYAGIPETATTAHTVTGAVTGEDTSSWAFQIDVPNTQKTGAYSGVVTFTATAVLT